MGADIKNLRTRIRSVDSTLHLTKAMGLVASSKIRRANEGMRNGREYAAAVADTVRLLARCAECAKSPYMSRRGNDRVKLVIIAGDRGLAGGYNANVFRLAREFPHAEIVAIGKRACEKYGQEPISSEFFSYYEARQLAEELCRGFTDAAFDRLGIIGTTYVSMMTQTAQVTWALPLQKDEEAPTRQVLFEPDETQILNDAVPEYVAGLLIAQVRESFASEVAARRMAMDSAGKNAQQMIDDLQLAYNRARQGTITQEITEIVAGSGM